MPSCVIYAFAYMRKAPRGPEDLPKKLLAELSRARKYAATQKYDISEQVLAVRTSRGSHFAQGSEFWKAVRLAREAKGTLILGSLYERLCHTHPDKMDEAIAAVLTAGVPVVDAATGRTLTEDFASSTKLLARSVAISRRSGRRGTAKSDTVKKTSDNRRAAQGARRTANIYAREIAEIVKNVEADLPAGTTLTRKRLADELNARMVRTRQGRQWTPENAGRLLRKISSP